LRKHSVEYIARNTTNQELRSSEKASGGIYDKTSLNETFYELVVVERLEFSSNGYDGAIRK
jgi:hypothetical protein